LFNHKSELETDLSKLLKEEGKFVKELSEVATKAAGFHARLESIEKAIGSDSSCYCSKEADDMVQKAEDKYSNELENSLKETANKNLKM